MGVTGARHAKCCRIYLVHAKPPPLAMPLMQDSKTGRGVPVTMPAQTHPHRCRGQVRSHNNLSISLHEPPEAIIIELSHRVT